jgi:hypothetical protein
LWMFAVYLLWVAASGCRTYEYPECHPHLRANPTGDFGAVEDA